MIRDIAGSTGDTIDRNYIVVYEYLQQNSAAQSPPELIRRFKNLLQNGRNEDVKVSQAFEKIVFAQREFDLFLSQCFYLIISTWLNSSESLAYIDRLLDVLTSVAQDRSYDRRRKQLINLITNYQKSQSYEQLKLALDIIEPTEASVDIFDSSHITNESANDSSSSKTPLISSYLIRYPYLYQNILPEEVATPSLTAKIAELQSIRQQNFEIELSQHIIYRFRLKQLAKMRMMSKGVGKVIVKAENPSLLSEKSFRIALKQYVGKLDGSTLQESAQLFMAKNKHRPTYRIFKQDLYRFLVKGIKSRSNTYQFESRLKDKLDSIFPQADEKALNPTQILQTCRQLFSFLIVDPASHKDSEQFVELVANLGTAQVATILVKITLICPESKADLSKKIYSIANRYRGQTVTEHPWLLKTLEYLLIAFSIYFGNVDVSLAKSVVNKS